MKPTIYKLIVCLAVLVLITGLCGYSAVLPAQEEKEETTEDSSGQTSCPSPYIKLVSPRAAAAGARITIEGARFGKDTGQVIFPGNLPAEVVSWRYQHIEVIVPDGAATGNITIISSCSSENKKGSGGYFKVLEKPKEK